jgi:glutathione S-transferase
MSESSAVRYELYYWPMLQGRGEFVRLALEDADAPYVDVARLPEGEAGGVQALLSLLREGPAAPPPFAPPILKVGELVIAQTANILLYLGRHHALAPQDEAGQLAAHQLQLTVTDLVAEVHDTHHPISSALYYEDQRVEAKQCAASFIEQRRRPVAVPGARGPRLRLSEGLRAREGRRPAPARAARTRRAPPAHRRLPRLGTAHSVQ